MDELIVKYMLYFVFQIQFMAYNTDIYSSLAEAVKSPYGVSVVAVFAEVRGIWILLFSF